MRQSSGTMNTMTMIEPAVGRDNADDATVHAPLAIASAVNRLAEVIENRE